MLPHQQRVVDELQQLTERTGKLLDFLSTDTFKSLAAHDQDLLSMQYSAMCVYKSVLEMRIERF